MVIIEDDHQGAKKALCQLRMESAQGFDSIFIISRQAKHCTLV